MDGLGKLPLTRQNLTAHEAKLWRNGSSWRLGSLLDGQLQLLLSQGPLLVSDEFFNFRAAIGPSQATAEAEQDG